MNYENAKQEYINAAILQQRCSCDGNHKIANQQYNVLKTIYTQIEQGKIEKEILIELLHNDTIEVRMWAAAHMLGLQYEVPTAEQELQKIATQPESGIIGFDAQMTLKVWRKKGFLNF
jgi:hypothetical protein